MRASGILLPISSLPGKYGIGSFSKEAYKFVDFFEKFQSKILADTTYRTNKLWRFTISVIFYIRRKSLLYQFRRSNRSGIVNRRGM